MNLFCFLARLLYLWGLIIAYYSIKYNFIMSKTITFNELRRIKNRLPEGSIHVIADKLNLPVQSVRNYFGGSNYELGTNMGFHLEPGPDGGLVVLDDPKILDMALGILENQNEQ